MQRLQALKQFPLAAGGVSVRMVEPGEEFQCSDESAPGLIAALLARKCAADFGVPSDLITGEPGERVKEVPNDEDDDDDGEAEKEAREPIENKDAGDPDGNSAGKRTKQGRKGA